MLISKEVLKRAKYTLDVNKVSVLKNLNLILCGKAFQIVLRSFSKSIKTV
jgi:hypothetical protein